MLPVAGVVTFPLTVRVSAQPRSTAPPNSESILATDLDEIYNAHADTCIMRNAMALVFPRRPLYSVAAYTIIRPI